MGDDVYSARFMHGTDTYVLSQPGPDGKIAIRCRFQGPAGTA